MSTQLYLIIASALIGLGLFLYSARQAGNRRYDRSERIKELQERTLEMIRKRKEAEQQPEGDAREVD